VARLTAASRFRRPRRGFKPLTGARSRKPRTAGSPTATRVRRLLLLRLLLLLLLLRRLLLLLLRSWSTRLLGRLLLLLNLRLPSLLLLLL
jgi:hypothetical protein